MPSFHFSATINETYYDALEKLFYFNPGQSRYYNRIVETVETFGQPRIVRINGMLTMKVEGLPENACVFVCHGNRLVGVTIYFKEKKTILNILHFAIDTTYVLQNSKDSSMLIGIIIEEIKRIAQKDPDIAHIKIPYTQRLLKI